MGGVGKTQSAVEYAHRHADDYDLVWWLDAEEPPVLASAYAQLAPHLGSTPSENGPLEDVCQDVRRLLERRKRWLLIFDNAADRDVLRDYLPRRGDGHVLITSRNPVWSGVADTMPIRSFPQSDAAAFLLKRTRENDEAAANELAKELGGLPLALEQAAAYIEEVGGTLAEYLRLFRERRAELLKRGKPSTAYPDTVATAWELSRSAAIAACPAAGALLNLLAWLAPEPFPLDALTSDAAELPEPLAKVATDPILLDEAVSALRRYSLIERGHDGVWAHRLVQAIAQAAMMSDEAGTWSLAAAWTVAAAFPKDGNDPSTWPRCSRLLSHALSVLAKPRMPIASVPYTALCTQVASYLIGKFDLKRVTINLIKILLTI